MKTLQFFSTNEETTRLCEAIACGLSLEMKHGNNGEIELIRGGTPLLICQLGGIEDGVLLESVLGEAAQSTAPTNADVRFVRKTIRTHFRNGLWFVNPGENVREFYREWFYSVGAVALATRGVVLRQFSGSINYALIDDVASEKFQRTRGRIIEYL